VIRFEQTGSDEPLDVRVITDDSNAELVTMQEAFENADATEMVASANLHAAVQHEDGLWSFIIPGREAGEVGEVLYDLGLADWLEEKNAELIDDMERRQREAGQER
jgi:hypothetical protein